MFSNLTAIFVALIIPGMLFGRAVMGVFAVLALISLIFQDYRQGWPVMQDMLASLIRYQKTILLIIAVLIPSVLWSYDLEESAQTILRSLFIAGFGGFLCHWLQRIPLAQRQIFARTLLVASLIIAIFGSYTPWHPEPYARLVGHWDEARNMDASQYYLLVKNPGYAIGIFVPILVWLSIKQQGMWRFMGLMAVLAVMLFAHQTYNSSILGGFVLAAITAAFIFMQSRLPNIKSRVLTLVGCILLLGVGSHQLIKRLPHDPRPELEVLGVQDALIDVHRQHIWLYVWDLGWRKPVTGWGMNALNKLPETDERDPVFNNPRLPGHPHNFLLEIFAETGLASLVILVALFLGWLLRQLIALCRQNRQVLAPMTLATIAGILPAALVSYSIWSPWWMLAIFMVIGLSKAIDRRMQDDFL